MPLITKTISSPNKSKITIHCDPISLPYNFHTAPQTEPMKSSHLIDTVMCAVIKQS